MVSALLLRSGWKQGQTHLGKKFPILLKPSILQLKIYDLTRHIRVFSKNNIGWSKASESITLRTNEDCEYQTRNIKIVLLRRQC